MKLTDLKAKLQKFDTVPKGFKTRAEWQELWKVGKSNCTDLLMRARKEKMCVMKKFRIRPGVPVEHYKFKDS